MEYLTFFNLTEDPFRLTPDPHYFFPSEEHNEILQSLKYAVEQKEGFFLALGEPGTGKTTTLKVFIDAWKDKAEVALIMTPRLSPEECLLAVLEDFNIKANTTNKNDILKAFRDFLVQHSLSGRRVIIIVDEAQNLPPETLEELRLLSNLETEKEKLLQIILIGQPELGEKLLSHDLKQLSQRITIRTKLSPLTLEETSDYISFRLLKAGKGLVIFDRSAKKSIHTLSKGVPRVINLLASRAMMAAYIDGSQSIKKKHVKYAKEHFKDIPLERKWPLKAAMVGAIGFIIGVVGAYQFIPSLSTQPKPLPTHEVPKPILPVQSLPQAPQALPPQPPEMPQPPQVLQPPQVPSPQVTQAPLAAQSPQVVNPPQPADSANMQESKTATQIAPVEMVVVTTNTATLRKNPSADAVPVTWASQGVTLKVLDSFTDPEGSQWYKVRISDGRETWIAASVVKATE